jgi:hypothetical protein
MKYRKLDTAGDYTLGTGADFLTDTPEAVGQAISTRLKLWQGEWFIDTTEGMAWATEVLGKRFQNTSPDSAIQRCILGTQGVIEIEEYSSTYEGNTRKLTVTATVSTIYGSVALQETV